MAPHRDSPSSPTDQNFHASSINSNSKELSTSSLESSSTASSLNNEDRISRPLIPGVYVPTICFFEPDTEDLDLDTIASHAVRMAKAGVAGIATQGSNGEAVHLSHSERQQVTSTTRTALRQAGFNHLPIIVGCGAQSTREAIELCKEAYRSGGDYALVLPPSYYAPLFAPGSKSILKFFNDVADASPVPIIIYNYPGAVSGIDLSSDIIIELSKHANIVGVKLTCGNTGKLNRIVAGTKNEKSSSSSQTPPFVVLGGSADFTLQSLVGGGHGILAGLANIAPKACVKTIDLYNSGSLAEAQVMQEIVARGDWKVIQGGIVGTKAGLEGCFGYGGVARRPLPQPSKEEAQRWTNEFKELVELESRL